MSEKKSNKERGHCIRKAILDYVIRYIQEHGYSPCVREIGQGVGLRSTSSVQNHLQKMFDLGMLESDEGFGTPRAIRVPGYKFVKADAES